MNDTVKAVRQLIQLAALARAGAEIKIVVQENVLFSSEHDFAAEFRQKRDVLGLLANWAGNLQAGRLAGSLREIRLSVNEMPDVSPHIKVMVLNTFLRELSANFVRAAAGLVSGPRPNFPIDLKPN